MIHEGIVGFDFNMKKNYIRPFFKAKSMAIEVRPFTNAQICLNPLLGHKNSSIYLNRRLSG